MLLLSTMRSQDEHLSVLSGLGGDCSHLLFRKTALLAAWRKDSRRILLVTYVRGDSGTAREGAAAIQTRGQTPLILGGGKNVVSV